MNNSRFLLLLLIIACFMQFCKQPKSVDSINKSSTPEITKDPYHYPDLVKYYSPDKVDFSEEYYDRRIEAITKYEGRFIETNDYDLSQIWQTKGSEQNGIIGKTYQRVQIHIDTAIQNEVSNSVTIIGKSKVVTNICRFEGEMRVVKAFLFNGCDDPSNENCGVLFLEYSFFEDSLQSHSGNFKGIVECNFYFKNGDSTLYLDESMDVADGYFNRTFVGTWVDYKTKDIKKCIWGDYRLPFCFDFDTGDGSIVINEKYKKNGWESLYDSNQLQEKWWLK